MAGTQLLPEPVGRDVPRELIHTAQIVGSEEAVRMPGLIARPASRWERSLTGCWPVRWLHMVWP